MMLVLLALSRNEVSITCSALAITIQATGTDVVDTNYFSGCFIDTPI